MKYHLVFLLSVLITFIQAQATPSAADAVSSALASVGAAGDEIKDALDKAKDAAAAAGIPASGAGGALDKLEDAVAAIGNDTLTIKGSFNGTDTTDMGFDYNYKYNGADWPSLKSKYPGVENRCGGVGNQSPINLLQPIWSYGWAYGDTIPKLNDAHETTYNNLRKGVKVQWPENISAL